MKHIYPLVILLFCAFGLKAQQKQYQVAAIGFYNLENMFDTINDPNKNDEDFLPDGSYLYNTAVYEKKLNHMAKVISLLGTDVTPDGVAFLGLAEVENRHVLEDLLKQPSIADRNYQIVHYDSPDERGIDAAFIYNPKYFRVISSQTLFVQLPLRENGDTNYTRDVLWVYGELNGEPMHIFVNHWPSRYGGELASSPLREIAAGVTKHVIDSLMAIDPDTKIVVMGDLNDDPVNKSVTKVLGAKTSIEKTKRGQLYNPYFDLYKKGLGTLAWHDAWNLFDQIMVSSGLLQTTQNGYFYHKAEVFNKSFLMQTTGKYHGYPYRSYVGGNYQGGYSDHFPVIIYLVKPVE